MKRVLIIAGETSGDLHGSSLMEQMKVRESDIDFIGIGGTRMIARGLNAVRHVRDMNFMGIVEVLKHLPFIRRTQKDIEHLLDTQKPDLAILIDYPGFNLRLAPLIKRRNIPVMYYISPQLWAWHTNRVKIVRKYVDRMVVLFAFERAFYKKHGIDADFVGHPLLDTVKQSMDQGSFRSLLGVTGDTPVIGLLPGSRPQEIERNLPAMAGAVRLLQDGTNAVSAVLGCASELDDSLYEPLISGTGIIPLREKSYDIMAHADVLVVTSGTATLESGVMGTPMVVVYRTSPLTYLIGKALVDVENIGMINIVAGGRIVPELWQDDVTPGNIAREVKRFLNDDVLSKDVRNKLSIARERLGEPGAAGRAAKIACEMLTG